MPWLKKAAEAPTVDKIWELSNELYRLYDASLHYCARDLTDGHVPASRISPLTPKPATKQQVDALVNRKLWHRLPDICASCTRLRKQHRAGPLPRGGYLVHDFLEYNPSRVEWEEWERKRAALASSGGRARASQAARSGGRFTSRTAGDDTSGAAGEKGVFDQPQHQPSAGENDQRPPAATPAGGPAPYSVPRTPYSERSETYLGGAGGPDAASPRRSKDRSRGGLTHIAGPVYETLKRLPR